MQVNQLVSISLQQTDQESCSKATSLPAELSMVPPSLYSVPAVTL